jgi:rubrerythrin
MEPNLILLAVFAGTFAAWIWAIRWQHKKVQDIQRIQQEDIDRRGTGVMLLFWKCAQCRAQVSVSDEPVETCPICRNPREAISAVQQVIVFPSPTPKE